MDSIYLLRPVIFLIQVLFGAYGALVMLRFLLQWVRADFYNPISQFVVETTTPLLRPLRRFIPGIGGIDLASLLLAWVVKTIELSLIMLVIGLGLNPLNALLWAIPALLELVLNIFFVAILIEVIFSWIGYQGGFNPAANLAYSLSRPLMDPLRSLLPPMSGLDISPMLATLIIVLLEMTPLPILKALMGSPF